MFPFQCTRGVGCGKRFRTESAMKKHMYSSCPIKITCEKCGTEFATRRKLHAHLSCCLGAPPSSTSSPPTSASSVPSSTPLLPSSTPLIPSVAPAPSACSSTPPPSNTSSCAPSSSGDQPVPKKQANLGPYLGHDDSYSVMLDSSFNLPSFELPAIKTFDLDKYLTGDVDFDLFSEND